jgi:microcompartment protein CcmL/EutN
MPFSSIGKFLPGLVKKPLAESAAVALALEAGTEFISAYDKNLVSRIRLASIKNGVLHVVSTSAPAAEKLKNAKNALFKAMAAASGIEPEGLKVTIRGSLDNGERF